MHIAHTAYSDTRIGVQANMSLTDRKIEGIFDQINIKKRSLGAIASSMVLSHRMSTLVELL